MSNEKLATLIYDMATESDMTVSQEVRIQEINMIQAELESLNGYVLIDYLKQAL